MKIRTDFVTNSSSSSFVVEIVLETMEGNKHSVCVPPNDSDGDYHGSLDCSAEDIANSSSIDELCDLLANSAVEESGLDDDLLAEIKNIDDEEEKEEQLAGYQKWGFKPTTDKAIAEFRETVKNDISDISLIKKITLTKKWFTWGECSSDYFLNLDKFAPEMEELAAKVCNSNGEDKKAAISEFKKYLDELRISFISERSDNPFPTNFLGSKQKAKVMWEEMASSIEKFAKLIADGGFSGSDIGEETTEIDMQTHKIKQKAEYYVY